MRGSGAFVGDGVATIVSGAAGGTGVTTYAENIGVMALTRIYSSLVFVVAALSAVAGARIWVDNRVDFSDNRNLIVAATTLVLGAGDFTIRVGNFALGGIGTATFGAILLWLLLGARG